MDIYEALKQRRMAFVEDDPILRNALTVFFETKGCRAESFDSAEAAAETATGGRYDIVISDRILPGENGLSFLRRVRECHPGTITVLMTAFPNPGLSEEIRRAGIGGLLLKPFTIEGLERLLGELFGEACDGGDPSRCAGPAPAK